MTLIKSISGIRGTIGGNPEDGLNPLAIVKFVAAYATFIKKNTKVTTNKIVVGRDARISGEMVKNVVCGSIWLLLRLPSWLLPGKKLVAVSF